MFAYADPGLRFASAWAIVFSPFQGLLPHVDLGFCYCVLPFKGLLAAACFVLGPTLGFSLSYYGSHFQALACTSMLGSGLRIIPV